jgi:hypothetical protein
MEPLISGVSLSRPKGSKMHTTFLAVEEAFGRSLSKIHRLEVCIDMVVQRRNFASGDFGRFKCYYYEESEVWENSLGVG